MQNSRTTERQRRLLFCSSHCSWDPSSGAALCTRELLELPTGTGGSNPAVAVGTTSQGGDSGRVQSSTDPRGLISNADCNDMANTCRYNVLGRQTADAATTLGAGVDGAVRLLTTAYDTGGRPYLYTSYADTAGSRMVNQMQQSYNRLGQLTSEVQNHGLNSATVQYGYSFVASAGGPTTAGW